MSTDIALIVNNDPISRARDRPPLQPELSAESRMHVRKRNGRLEAVDVNKIVRAVERSAGGLSHVDIMRVAVKTIGGLFDGATTPAASTRCSAMAA